MKLIKAILRWFFNKINGADSYDKAIDLLEKAKTPGDYTIKGERVQEITTSFGYPNNLTPQEIETQKYNALWHLFSRAFKERAFDISTKLHQNGEIPATQCDMKIRIIKNQK